LLEVERAGPVYRARDPTLTSSPNKEANVAFTTVALNSFSAQPLTITSEQTSRYAELASLVSELEAQQKSLRAELLDLHKAGAEQETDSPYLLALSIRRIVDWKLQALTLAEKLYGIEKAGNWKAEVEASAPVQPITQVRVKANPVFAVGLRKPAETVRIPLNLGGSEAVAAQGD
jgi:hypothetical protein